MPTDWAMTQNNLGNVLQTFGERTGDTARLDEAVAAYRAALEVFTRADMPKGWAGIHTNLAMALKTMGELSKSAWRFQEARIAVLGALEVEPNDPETRDTLKQIDQAIAKLRKA